MDVVSVAGEEMVRLDCDLDERIARLAFAEAGAALAAQPEHLAVLDSSRNRHIESSAFRQCQLLDRAGHRFEEFDRQLVMYVRTAGAHANICASPQKFGQDVVGIRKIRKAGIIFVSVTRRSLGGEIAIEMLPRLFGSARVNLATIISRTLIRIGK